MEDPRTDRELFEALDDVRATLDLLVAHLSLEDDVHTALSARRAKAERSRVEIERSLGRVEFDGDGRR